MSYIPDYRCDENRKLLNDQDRAFLAGFDYAMEQAAAFFDEAEDLYDVKYGEKDKKAFEDWSEMGTVEAYCGIMEGADYIDENAELVDMNDVNDLLPYKYRRKN